MNLRRLCLALLGLGWLGGAAPPSPPVDLQALLADSPAPTLQAYRLFEGPGVGRPNRGVTAYALNTPLFSDYALKQRYLFLPPGAHATYAAAGVLDFPVGATLVKTFAYPADFRSPDRDVRLLETRLLIHKSTGWSALTYVWNPEQTRADLKRAGQRLPVEFVDADGSKRSLDYLVPNQNQCKECHSQEGVLSPIGPKARNLNGYLSQQRGGENQLVRWSRLGMLKGAPPLTAIGRTARWDDAAEPLSARARAYLDANCGHCHSPAGLASNSGLYLNWEENNASALGLRRRPVAAGRGAGDLLYDIDPGRPETSILTYRMESVEPGVMMPQIGRSVVHREGVALVKRFIASMAATPGSLVNQARAGP